MEELVKAVQAQYPGIDHMMAETICKMHEQGKLAHFAKGLQPSGQRAPAVLSGAVAVENNVCSPSK